MKYDKAVLPEEPCSPRWVDQQYYGRKPDALNAPKNIRRDRRKPKGFCVSMVLLPQGMPYQPMPS